MTISAHWALLVDHHRRAQIERNTMDDKEASQVMLDGATERYARHLDAMMLAMDGLRRQGALADITVMLATHRVAA